MNEFEKFNSDFQFTTSKTERKRSLNQPELAEEQNNTQKELPVRDLFEKTPEELEKIKKICSQFKEGVELIQPPKQEIPAPQNPIEIEIINGQQYTVEYVPKEDIYPAYGYSRGNNAIVRQDLPPRVKKFVRTHELYHCQDKSNLGGALGREIRANVIPGLKDPVGLTATVWATLTNIDRLKLYLKRIKEGY